MNDTLSLNRLVRLPVFAGDTPRTPRLFVGASAWYARFPHFDSLTLTG